MSESGYQASSVKNSIVLTLAYSDQFLFCLSKKELWQRLIRVKDGCTQSQFERAVAELAALNLIQRKEEWMCLGYRDIDQLIVLRKTWSKRVTRLQPELEQASQVFSNIPTVQAVYVTGSVAAGSPKKVDDLDFLIVAQPGTLWITRFLVITKAWLQGKKKAWWQAEGTGWCLNLFVDAAALDVFSAPARRNLYTAYELIQAYLLFSKESASLVSSNSWVGEWLENVSPTSSQKTLKNNYLLQPLNGLLFVIQWLYMRSRISREFVSYRAAFFHPRPTNQRLLQGMAQSVYTLLKGTRAR